MSDNRKETHIEDLERLENLERSSSGRQGRQRGVAREELPELLYRLKTLHSCETFYGSYEPPEGEWPHFRTLDELEALLEGPFASSADHEPAQEAVEEAIGFAAVAAEESVPAEAETASVTVVEAPALTAAEATADAIALAAANAAAEVSAGIPAEEPEADQAADEPAAMAEAGAGEGEVASVAGADQGQDAAEPVNLAEKEQEHYIPRRALVVAPTKYGRDIVEVQGKVNDRSLANADEVVAIERPAGIDDLRRLKDNTEKEKRAFELCRDKIWARNLPMKLVSAHYLIDEPKILFYFAAESRVDFRELVKDLVSLFKTRIELRQIGVRDEARVTGGCGVCGRVLCCHGISDRLNPVSIKMAKDQNLSLNSLKISGPCGRLLCCLSYEFQFYRDARRELPQEGVKFIYDGTLFKVVEVNALASMVKMAGEDGRVLDMKADRFKYSEGRWKVIEDVVE